MTERPPNPRSPVPGWQEVLDAPVFLDPADTDAELARNTWLLQASGRQRAGTTPDELVAWIRRLVEDRRVKVAAVPGRHATFYLWLDDASGALGVGLISGWGATLPFNGRIQRLPAPQPLLDAFLGRAFGGVIPGARVDADLSEPLSGDPDTPVIDVYVVEL